MLLRRITQHVNDQNWFAVGVDFCIVVIGVFLGIQVANWNETQANKRTAQAAVESVQAELSSNQVLMQTWIDAYDSYTVHALAALDGLKRPMEERGEQFVIDAYQASGYGPITLPRNAYNDLLALGPSKALIDEELRQHLVSHYFFLDAMAINLHNVPAYKSRLRSVMPYDVELRIRTQCPVQVDVLKTAISLPKNCQPELSVNQIERAVAELSAAELKHDLNLILSDMYLKISVLRLLLSVSEKLEDHIESNT